MRAAVIVTMLLMPAGCASTSVLVPYQVQDDGISAPLSNATPDPARGRALLVSRESNCTLCHAAPETGERFFGTVGPPLSGVGKRLTAALKLEIPHLAENGHLVPLTVSVESPMTPADYVRTLYLLSEKNPRPLIAKIGMGPGTGRAALTTRIRLAGAQYVVALAHMSDGSFWAGTTEVIVTETACMDAS